MSNTAKAILVEQIDALLPQTQCGKCGHGGCQPYAEAMADGEDHNKCPPGGEPTLTALAELLKRPVLPLEQPAESPRLAVIREDECIGCTKCIQACPVDAIVGAAKQMHGVLETECTGCELCVEPCPVDCIDIVPHPQWQQASNEVLRQHYLDARASNGRQRFAAHNRRIEALQHARDAKRLARLKKRLPPDQSEDATRSVHSKAVTATPASRETQASTAKAPRRGNNPMVARLEHKLSRLPSDDPRRPALEERLAQASQANTAADDGHQRRQLRMALAAAEQRRRLAERHLKHCHRQAPEQVASAEQELAQAQATERDISAQLAGLQDQ